MEFEKLEITDEVRALQPGSFVKISDGTVHYELEGSESGEIVALVHGLTTPLFIWDPTFEMLTKEGFRVLRYDLFGRGYSDRPKVKYNKDLYDRQLLELLTELKLTKQTVNIVGLSLGGAICTNFAISHPDLVKRVILIDSAFPSKMQKKLKLMSIPVLNKLMFKISNPKSLIAAMSKNFYRIEDFPDYSEKFTEQMQYKGFTRAVVSTMVDGDLQKIPERYRKLGELNIPVQLFWGEHDALIPYESIEKLKEAIPNNLFHSIEKAGHVSHYERPDLVNPLLLKFLKS